MMQGELTGLGGQFRGDLSESCWIAVWRTNLSDPCYNYTVLDNPWRSISNTDNSRCDQSVSWSGWYRLFMNGLSADILDTCISQCHCGTQVPLWMRGGHPTVVDGVVTRDMCGSAFGCCDNPSNPIRVKACPSNYYVYELSPNCFQNLLEQIENISTSQVLSVTTVTNILTMAFNASEKILESSSSSSSVSPAELASQGNSMLKTSEKLISTLVKPTNTSDNVSFTLDAVEGQVFMVGPNVALDKIPRLDTTNSSVDIDLIGIAKNNNERSAAVAFMSFNTMENLLKPDFFNTSNDTIKTMMSTVISATLPKTTNTKLTKPVNFTLKHIREFDPSGSLSCVYWNISEWIVDGCSVLETNSSYTVCSCVHLSTFALIMQTSRPPESDSLLELLNLVCVIVGLVFFSLALLTFALCQWSPGVNNVARINICISLLLAHLLFLLTQQFLSLIRPHQVLCAVISGVLHFLFLSSFVWMFIEAVLLFICVKNLSQISSKKREVLSSGFLCLIGYMVALVVAGVSVGLLPEGYGSEQCWIKMDKGFIWSFLGPVCVILAVNMILFINITIRLNSTLKNLNAEVSQMKQTKTMTFKTLAQFVVLGCPWILGFFIYGRRELEILFVILNSQQGTFIFLVYCVLNNEIRQQYMKFFKCLCCGRKQH
ncbi:putative adhesion G protein-coupled receptor E4P [Chanodichthys erythropterus]|uniref:putative adhesion G protein-coupled receptor E4P n=1 Tax=Chanodichthys erythropterus TaxID=933992 RepID=UPI00351E0900